VLIAIEGADRCGKQTQTGYLLGALRQRCHRVVTFEVPFNDAATYRLIYWMLKNGQAKSLPNVFQFVQFLNKFVFQWTILLWSLLTNDYVILDRWKLSTIVYGDATGANKWFTRFLCWFLFQPKATVVMHGQRLNEASEDVYEADSELQRTVRRGYHFWACNHFSNHFIVLNEGTRTEVHQRLMNKIWNELF